MTVTTTAVAWYAGTGAAADSTVVRRGRTTVLLADDPAGAARAVWAGAGARSPVTAVLDALASLPGTTLTTLPPFAAVTVADDGGAHVLVRGRFRAVLGTGAGSVVVEAADVSTWHERRVADVTTVVLGTQPRAAAEVLADEAAWPLAEGVVRAGEVALEVVPGAAGAPDADDAPATAQPTPTARPTPPVKPTPTVKPTPAAVELPAVLSVPEVETMLPTAGQDDADGVPEPDPAAPEPTAVPADEEAPAPEATQAGPVDVADDGYAHLWGATVMRTVEDAAVRPEDDEEAAEEEGSAQPAAASPVAAPAAPAPALSPAPAPDPSPVGAGLIAGIPRTWAGAQAGAQAGVQGGALGASLGTIAPPPAAPAPAPLAAPASPAAPPPPPPGDDETDHDGHTVMSSALAHLRTGAAPEPAPAPPAPPVGAGPQVLARSCPDGHANPPSRDACRTCGAPLTQEAGLAVRPVLGRVRVAGGPQLDLDRPLVVGRRPRTPRSSAGEMPRLVTVVSPNQDVSRSHVEVRLEGWHVLVTDLATTNGTVLHRGGQPPQRLHPSEATLVVDGDVVDLGDGATLTFEEIW
ncbi:FHA domain containing protein [Xylanimonas cellulosilytica DSM 15894]|uniref:FHA domain containing protein n=1 Tax=Xylanimonas cellulosilytica (strain DSM 15894 / JCM 12276 / CECT 5975 / KCTC 9989 / LMG 20990 / NBRC 107835 / XIL07) TaxID=446471 RepID=D1BW26_XYLCX|nr:FHA domain-containing protein [Xylanimonas cellulosilytica]ACZ29529.1 FHA domain containing protein [Xylanimonas cellulosilytica DSM 15894]